MEEKLLVKMFPKMLPATHCKAVTADSNWIEGKLEGTLSKGIENMIF